MRVRDRAGERKLRLSSCTLGSYCGSRSPCLGFSMWLEAGTRCVNYIRTWTWAGSLSRRLVIKKGSAKSIRLFLAYPSLCSTDVVASVYNIAHFLRLLMQIVLIQVPLLTPSFW